jgi:hypothetical protein
MITTTFGSVDGEALGRTAAEIAADGANPSRTTSGNKSDAARRVLTIRITSPSVIPRHE